MNELYESVDKNKLYFEYIGPTKDVSFYEYKDSEELFNAIKNNQLKFYDTLKRQKELLNKINEVKTGKKAHEQNEVIDNLEKSYNSREEAFNFFRDYTKMMFDSSYQKKDETKGTGLKILTPK